MNAIDIAYSKAYYNYHNVPYNATFASCYCQRFAPIALFSYNLILMALIISAGVGCGEDHLAQNIETSVEDTTVSISWDPPYERVQLVHFDVECSTLNQTTRTSVGNQTHTAQLIGLSSYTAYNCCVLAVFQSYTSKVCAHNNIYTRLYSGSTYQTNGSCVICVVYGIIINTILSILLALAIVASIYPCLIRPRIRKSKSKILSR